MPNKRSRRTISPTVRCLIGAAALHLASLGAARAQDGAAEAVAAQASAWNRGDLEAALASYADSTAIAWVNRRGVTRGFEAFARSMRDSFGGQPEKMGRYSYEILERRNLGDRAAIIVLRWVIRTASGTDQMGGISTQLWERHGTIWRVTLEHAS